MEYKASRDMPVYHLSNFKNWKEFIESFEQCLLNMIIQLQSSTRVIGEIETNITKTTATARINMTIIA